MAESEAGGERLPVLIFEIGRRHFCLDARKVESVVAWHEPVKLPGGHPRIRGVLQDRGRVVTVLQHPFDGSDPPAPTDERPLRILVCSTPQGHLGIVASQTFEIETLTLAGEPSHGTTIETSRGPATFAASDAIALEIVGD